MQNSLEVRVPFLDYRLVPLVLSLPENYKIRGLKTKWLLKKFASSYLPTKIISRKKRGFSVPLSNWIKENSTIQEYLLDESFYTHELFEQTTVERIYEEHILSRKDHSRGLWLIFVFNYWWHLNSDKVSV